VTRWRVADRLDGDQADRLDGDGLDAWTSIIITECDFLVTLRRIGL